jgi:hypothetical protein
MKASQNAEVGQRHIGIDLEKDSRSSTEKVDG